MRGVNKAIIVGNLGKDPDMRYTNTGAPVARFSVATSESWLNKQTNNREERTEWHNIVVWGKMAEVCGEYLKKGRQVYVEGRIQTRNYDDKEGNKKYITEIVAATVQFLGGNRGEGASAGPSAPISNDDSGEVSMGSKPGAGTEAAPTVAFENDDDIPF